MITNEQFMSYVSALPSAKKTALLASTSADFPLAFHFYSGNEGHFIDEKPAANVLHKINNIKTDMSLYLNYKPSFLELGMAWRAGEIHNVYFIDSNDPLVMKQYKINVDGFELQDTCDLKEVTPFTAEQMAEIEKEEPRIKNAFGAPICERTVNPSICAALRRGIGKKEPIIDTRDNKKIDEDFMHIALSLVDRGWNSKDGKTQPADRVNGNNIGAIMVDANNNIIGWGLNLKSENKTFHAETLMIQRYLRENNTDKLPDGVKIYTSLECCHMCAGHIADLSKDAQVIYAQKDPYFSGDNVLKLGVNNSSQKPTTLPHSTLFDNLIKPKENILDFLFSDRSRIIFERGGYEEAAMFVELLEAVQERAAHFQDKVQAEEYNNAIPQELENPSPILTMGEEFLSELGNFAPSARSLPPSNFFSSRSLFTASSVSPSIAEIKEKEHENSEESALKSTPTKKG